ncbi:MAG: TIGR00730 family Rossman fold protein [Verrucomicrobia bacterium]|nr:TIGR00730 family Rossman fold protein [Verrucomicrobiota bacterium]
MQDFTAGGIHALRSAFSSSGDPGFDRRIQELVQDWGVRESPELIAEMIVTALRMGSDGVPVPDLKMINRSLKELRQAAATFAPYSGIRKVAVFGSARTPPDRPEARAAERFSMEMRERGFMIITGGGDGIMGAAQRGAGREHSFGLNIRLPFEQKANEIIEGDPKLVVFNYFFTRKVNFVKETHAIVLFPGGFGTMDEGFEILTLMQTGKARIIPIVLVDKPGGSYWRTWVQFLKEHFLAQGLISPEDFNFFRMFDRVEDAVEEVINFYRNFHSYRWVGQELVIRLHEPLAPAAIERINDAFRDVFSTQPLKAGEPLRQEKNEPELYRLPRLICRPQRRNFGRLRALIDEINRSETLGPGNGQDS